MRGAPAAGGVGGWNTSMRRSPGLEPKFSTSVMRPAVPLDLPAWLADDQAQVINPDAARAKTWIRPAAGTRLRARATARQLPADRHDQHQPFRSRRCDAARKARVQNPVTSRAAAALAAAC